MANDLFNKTKEYVQPEKVDEWESYVAKNRRVIGNGYKFGQTEVYMKILCENKRPSFGYLCRIIAKNPEETIFYGKLLSEYVRDDLGVEFAKYLIEKGGLTKEVKEDLQAHLDRLAQEKISLAENARMDETENQ